MLPLGPAPRWTTHAECAAPGEDAEAWFDPDRYDEARQVCRRCPVAASCLDYARDHGIREGVWGATTPADRGWCGAEFCDRRAVAGSRRCPSHQAGPVAWPEVREPCVNDGCQGPRERSRPTCSRCRKQQQRRSA